jgi:hypothetical protein
MISPYRVMATRPEPPPVRESKLARVVLGSAWCLVLYGLFRALSFARSAESETTFDSRIIGPPGPSWSQPGWTSGLSFDRRVGHGFSPSGSGGHAHGHGRH